MAQFDGRRSDRSAGAREHALDLFGDAVGIRVCEDHELDAIDVRITDRLNDHAVQTNVIPDPVSVCGEHPELGRFEG